MYSDDELLPLSALQHMLFCPRQCALIHVEKLWEENRFTAEGRIMHERVDQGGGRGDTGCRVLYAMVLKSQQLGLIGKADAVEFHESPRGGDINLPYPVEYKRGKPKKDASDEVQLCAQAICLEEAYGMEIEEGSLFYGKTRRRKVVRFDSGLRALTAEVAETFHRMVEKGVTPAAEYTKKCDACSFVDLCMPKVLGRRSVSEYLKEVAGKS